MLKQALQSTSWVLVDKVATMGLNLLATLVIARTLGPEQFGVLAYLLALVTLIGPLAALGFNAIVTREVVEQPQREVSIMSTVCSFRLLGAVVGNGLLLGWAWLFGELSPAQFGLLCLMAGGYTLNAFRVFEFYFQAKMAIKYVAIVRTTIALVFTAAKVTVALTSGEIFWVGSVYAMEFFVLGLGFIALYRWYSGSAFFRQINWRYGLSLLRQSSWLVLSSVASIIYLKVDQIMLANMVDNQAVGIYAVAARLSEVWYFIAEAIVISFFPMLLQLKSADAAHYQQRLQQLCDSLFVLALTLALVVTVIAGPVVTLLFGEAYAASATVLSIHIWAGVFVFMRALASKWIIAHGLMKYSLLSHGLGAIINIVVNLIAIPRWGALGAAWATVVSYATASYLVFWLAPATRPIAGFMSRSLLLPLTLGYRYWHAAGAPLRTPS
ncbi:MAG: flippase [Pseudomonadota bacterium]|nr:flippase [Pseudomonadota bacterium]